MGLIHVSPPVKYKQPRVCAAGAAVLSYDKHYLLPAFESKLRPGETPTLISEPSGIWGVAICKDTDLTPLSCQHGEVGTDLMLVPAWDFNWDRA